MLTITPLRKECRARIPTSRRAPAPVHRPPIGDTSLCFPFLSGCWPDGRQHIGCWVIQLGIQDSNPDRRRQKTKCCRYTNPHRNDPAGQVPIVAASEDAEVARRRAGTERSVCGLRCPKRHAHAPWLRSPTSLPDERDSRTLVVEPARLWSADVVRAAHCYDTGYCSIDGSATACRVHMFCMAGVYVVRVRHECRGLRRSLDKRSAGSRSDDRLRLR